MRGDDDGLKIGIVRDRRRIYCPECVGDIWSRAKMGNGPFEIFFF